MFDVFKKDPELELDETTLSPKAKTMPQKIETPQTTDLSQQIECPQLIDSSNSTNNLDLLASLQKMKKEEQELQEQKQRLLTTEQTLHSKLIKEIDKKKTAINNLKTEIPDILNRCKELSQALDLLSK
jgi:exonuclease VII large subunit